MRVKFAIALPLATLALGACSNSEPAPQAPAGAMESFAEKHAQDNVTAEDQRIEAARVREAGRAADARQKVQAAEGIDRFERAERELDRNEAGNAQ